MGWKAIKSLNKQEHLDRESAQNLPVSAEEPKNALRELPRLLSETHEIITGSEGWMVAVPFETPTETFSEPEPEVPVLPVEAIAPSVEVTDVTSAPMIEVTSAKKPPGKKKKATEPT